MNSHSVILSTETFPAEVLEASVPVLVDFWADGCAPCRALSPVLDAVAAEYAGRAKVGKLKLEDNLEIAAEYQIRGIPTLILFHGGKIVDQRIGSVGKSELHKMIDAQL